MRRFFITIPFILLSLLTTGCTSVWEYPAYFAKRDARHFDSEHKAQPYYVVCTAHECRFVDNTLGAKQVMHRLRHREQIFTLYNNQTGKVERMFRYSDLSLYRGKYAPRAKIYGAYLIFTNSAGTNLSSMSPSANPHQKTTTWNPNAPALKILRTSID